MAIATLLVSFFGPARAADDAQAVSVDLLADGGLADASQEGGPGALGPDRQKAADIHALVAGTLGVTVSPASLFDAPLDDVAAAALEGARIRALLRGARDLAGALVDGGPDAAADMMGVVGDAWQDRLALDRARSAFFALPIARRHELIEDHARRVAEAKPRETEEEQRVREAEAERLQALQAAKDARTEAARVVAEEHARLLELEQKLEATKRRFESDEKAITSRKDAVLGWQRRAREARSSKVPTEVGATYDALRRTLHTTRNALDAELDGIDATSVVPQLGPDPLTEIPAQIDAEAPRNKRRALKVVVGNLEQIEGRLRVARVEQLLEETDTLNRERLSLIVSLSSQKRGEVTGFTATGWDQAQAELRQLTLIVRYHRFVATRWLASLRKPGGALGSTIGRSLAVIVPWALLLAAFVWWRRRGGPVLEAVQTRLSDNDRAARLAKPSYALRGFRFLRAVHVPLEWLALFLTMMWLLPTEAQAILEVQLITVVVGWTLAGAFIVDAIDAAVTTSEPATIVKSSGGDGPGPDSSQLRLRSLRLIGRVVVTIILILVISARLVGEGAIYSWVLSTCWLAAFPITLLLVRWWRETIFARVERVRRKSRFQTWALANRTGWTSFPSATSAGAHLFVTGAIRSVRGWLGGFDLVRRVAAYLFRRELAKLDMAGKVKHLAPLGTEAYDGLAPAQPMNRWVATDVDAKIDAVLNAMASGRGGVFALVGERGAGKSSVFDRFQQRASSAIRAQCEGMDLASLRARLTEAASLPLGAPLESFGAAVDAKAAPRAVLLDDAHAFVRMVMGGLADFDGLMAVARAHSKHAVWIVSLDDTVWQFLQRARGVRPLFDDVLALEPWSAERIAELIEFRTEQAGVTPTFEDLLEQLPPNADEIDKQDALRERKAGYYRLIWDHALGNPGVALHVWRGSLGLDEDGAARVRHLQVPATAELEGLPYPTLFILRAVLQLAPASADELTRATQLTATEISDALRYSLAHGYLVESDDGRLVDISWTWLRSITRLLQRRHLLVLR